MHLGGKCKISWSNDDLERFLMFLKVRTLWTPHESIRSQGAMAGRVTQYYVENTQKWFLKYKKTPNGSFNMMLIIWNYTNPNQWPLHTFFNSLKAFKYICKSCTNKHLGWKNFQPFSTQYECNCMPYQVLFLPKNYIRAILMVIHEERNKHIGKILTQK